MASPAADDPTVGPRHLVVLDGGEPVELDDDGADAVARVIELCRHGRRPVVTTASDDLSTTEAARMIGVSREWVARLVDAGEIEGYRVGTHRRIPRRAVEAHLAPRTTSVAPPTLRALRRRRAAIESVVAAKGGTEVRVFGSVARGEAGPGSDVDLFVALPAGTGLMDLAELEADLSDLLGARVDIVPTSAVAMSPHLEAALAASIRL